jgi:hypothetical protein
MNAQLLKVSLIWSVLGPGTEGFCQWELHAWGGLGTGLVRTEYAIVESRGERQSAERQVAWSVGTDASHSITEKLTFRTGIVASSFGGQAGYWARDLLWEEQEWRVHYLYVPLLVRFNFHRAYAGAGYQLGIPIQGSSTGTFYGPYASGTLSAVHYGSDMKSLLKTDIGVVAEAGYAVTERIDAGLRYNKGLRDIRAHTDGVKDPLYTEQLILAVRYQVLPRAQKEAQAAPLPPEED